MVVVVVVVVVVAFGEVIWKCTADFQLLETSLCLLLLKARINICSSDTRQEQSGRRHYNDYASSEHPKQVHPLREQKVGCLRLSHVGTGNVLVATERKP